MLKIKEQLLSMDLPSLEGRLKAAQQGLAQANAALCKVKAQALLADRELEQKRQAQSEIRTMLGREEVRRHLSARVAVHPILLFTLKSHITCAQGSFELLGSQMVI